MNLEEYNFLKRKIRSLLQFNLDSYKSNQMIRRLEGYIGRTKNTDVVSYCSFLEQDIREQTRLKDFLTINVSEFFRDAAHFEILRNTILPSLSLISPVLNIWSAGCSNGAEAYSVALILEHRLPRRDYRILATDIDDKSLKIARSGGPYRLNDIRNLPREMLTGYLASSGDSYLATDKLKSLVEFRKHDLTADPFERGFDLIICRNVVIYFTEEVKNQLRDKFVNSIKENGILFIGATETMLDADAAGLDRISPCFYRKKPRSNKESVFAGRSAMGVKV